MAGRPKGSHSESFLFIYHNLADSQQREFGDVQEDVGGMKAAAGLYWIETLIMFQGYGILLDEPTFKQLRRMSGDMTVEIWREVTGSMVKHGYLVEYEGRYWTIKALETLEAVIKKRATIRKHVDNFKDRRAVEEFIRVNTLPELVVEETRLKLTDLENSNRLETVMVGKKTGDAVKKDYALATFCGFSNGCAMGLALNFDTSLLKQAENAVKNKPLEDRMNDAITILKKENKHGNV